MAPSVPTAPRDAASAASVGTTPNVGILIKNPTLAARVSHTQDLVPTETSTEAVKQAPMSSTSTTPTLSPPAFRPTQLRQLGAEVLTIQDAGQTGQSMSGESVLAFAHSEGRAHLTLNRKQFIRLHEANKPHSGIIACTCDPDFRALAQQTHAMIQEDPRLDGKLIRINRPLR